MYLHYNYKTRTSASNYIYFSNFLANISFALVNMPFYTFLNPLSGRAIQL
jgi:hypothetical protein